MFKKILIANRGEIAVRVIRACREMGIESVALFSEVDKDCLAVRLADEAYSLGDSRSYLDMEKIISIAKEVKAEAIHPGYGFLSENSSFARRCQEENLVFIGPSPVAIEKMGNKAVARETMMKAGVPVIPGSEGIIGALDEAYTWAAKIGYPVLVKASAGGGGKGMRIASSKAELKDALEGAKSEAENCFGNSEVYLEKYLEDCKHIEFQILADSYGEVVHLGERDCSVQRRNQKLIEEAPSPALSSRLRKIMGKAAICAAKAVDYLGVGTVEFIFTKHGEFYFMEMNTRIQVEHPVTEMITGIDLIREQIGVAAGKSLSYKQKDIVIRGHAIECRINAEDPANGFMPFPGQITEYRAPGGFGVRLDSAAYSGFTISPYYDSMIAKLIVWDEDREKAINKMKSALKEFEVKGIKTTMPFHLLVLNNPYFRKGEVFTNFIETKIEQELQSLDIPDDQENNCLESEIIIPDTSQVNIPQLAPNEMSSEVVAAISGAISHYSQVSGTEFQIKNIRQEGQNNKTEFSPWRILGLHRLLNRNFRG